MSNVSDYDEKKPFYRKVIDILTVVFEYFFMLSLLLECNSMYAATKILGLKRNVILFILVVVSALVLCAFLLYRNQKRKEIIISGIKVFVCMCVFTAVFAFMNLLKYSDDYCLMDFIRIFTCFIPLTYVIFLCYRSENKPYRLFHVLGNIVVTLAGISLVFWAGKSFFDWFDKTSTVTLKWGGTYRVYNYYYVWFLQTKRQFETIPLIGIRLRRNCGIFPEAPQYNIFLVLATYIELFVRPEEKKALKIIRLVILLITSLTSFGYIGLMLMVIGYFIKASDHLIQKYGKKAMKWIAGLSLGVIGVLVVLVLSKMANSSYSFGIHVDDYIATFKTWMKYPLFGCGYRQESTIREMMDPKRTNTGISNSFGLILAQGGIWFIGLYLGAFRTEIRNIRKDKTETLFYTGFILLVLTTIFTYRLLQPALLAFAYSLIGYRKSCNEKNGGK